MECGGFKLFPPGRGGWGRKLLSSQNYALHQNAKGVLYLLTRVKDHLDCGEDRSALARRSGSIYKHMGNLSF
jgi:hypothetical protein